MHSINLYNRCKETDVPAGVCALCCTSQRLFPFSMVQKMSVRETESHHPPRIGTLPVAGYRFGICGGILWCTEEEF
jgi:hypothetical protein